MSKLDKILWIFGWTFWIGFTIFTAYCMGIPFALYMFVAGIAWGWFYYTMLNIMWGN